MRARRDAKIEDLLEAVPNALVGVDLEGVIRFVNGQTQTLFGHSRDAMIGKPVEMLVPESLRQVHRGHRDGHAVDLEPRAMGSGFQARGQRRDGTEFPLDIALSHVDTADGLLVIAAVRDLTGHPAVEGARILLSRLAAIVEHSDDAILGKTLDGTITSWNQAAQRMYGYTSGEIIGRPVASLIPEGRTGEAGAILAMVRAGQPFKNFETLRVRKDGSVFPASLTISPIRDADGVIIGASTVARDMTTAKEAFAAAQRMAAIVEHSDDAIIGRTLDGVITSWNPAAERMFQYSSQEIVGRSSDLLASVDRTVEIRSLMTRIRAGHVVERVETIGVRKDGSVFPASLTISPIRDGDGVVIGASTIARDVTEAQLAQLEIAEQRAVLLERLAELDRANADLLSVNKVMQGFIDVAAHDLRTPLSSVVGYSDLLTEGWTTLDEDTKRKFAATINRQSHNLAGLVDDLLTLSSIEGGAAATRPRAVVVAAAISGCLEKLVGSVARVSVSCSPDLVALVDPTHLGRIIDNYLSNAITYGGPPVRIEATRHDGAVQIQVIDHGPGVPAEFVPRLFGKFAQADSWGAEGRGGAGLGLSIAGGLAKVNGGRASYRPNAEGGSSFIVSLPVHDPDR